MSVRCDWASRASSVFIAAFLVAQGAPGVGARMGDLTRSTTSADPRRATARRRRQPHYFATSGPGPEIRPPSSAAPVPLVQRVGGQRGEQVGPAARRCAAAPGRAATGRSGRGRRSAGPPALQPAPRRRLGVDRRLQQPVGVRLLGQRVGVAEHAGQQPGHRLHDHEHRDLAAEQHVVAERDLARPASGRRRGRSPAGRCPRTGRRRRSGAARPASSCASRLGERRARPGVGTTSRRRRRATSASSASPHGSGRITMPGPAAVRGVVDRPVHVVGPGRRSCTARSSSPAARAWPISDRSSGARYSGKIVTMSTRIDASQVEQARRAGRPRPGRRPGRPRARSP